MRLVLYIIIGFLLSSNLLAQEEAIYTYFNESNGFADISVRSLYVDSQGMIWIGTDDEGVYTYYEGLFTHYPYFSNGFFNENYIQGVVNDFKEDSEGNIWIAIQDSEYGGIYQYDGSQINLVHPFGDNSPLLTYRVMCLFVDQEHNDDLWVGYKPSPGITGGLQIFKEDTILTYSYDHGNSPDMYGVSEIQRHPSDTMFVIAGNEIAYLEMDNAGNFYTPEIPIFSGIYNANNIIFGGEHDIIMSSGHGVLFYDEGIGWDVYSSPGGGGPHGSSDCVFKDSDAHMWTLTGSNTDYKDLHRLAAGTWTNYGEFEIAVGFGRAWIIEDEEHNIWIGTNDGLVRISNVIYNPTDLLELAETNILKSYPNPAHHTLYVDTPIESSYGLFDAQGKVVSHGTLAPSTNTINVASLPNGFYCLKINNQLNNITQRVLIQH